MIDIARELARLHVLEGAEFVVATDYNGMALARSIKKYFELNPNALEVMIFKKNKLLEVTRKSLDDKSFLNTFRKRYNK